MFDIISIGDSTQDVFIEVEESEVHCHKGSGKCHICFDWATKLAIKSLHDLVGGNAANNAVGSARLGLKAGFYCEVGDDDTGRKIINALKKDGVSLKYFKVNKKIKSNYSIVINKGAERTILVYHEKRNYKLPKLDKSKWIYLTSAGKGSERMFLDIIIYVKKTGAKLGFNPGTHQMNLGLKKLLPLFRISEVVSLNVEEAQFIFGEGKRDVKLLLRRLKDTGTKIAVITDGPKGSYAYDGKRYYFCPIYDVPIVERTGCGDAYTTGFICALIYGLGVKEAMRWGTFNASGVIQKIGPQAGLLYKKDMLKLAKKRLKVREI